MTPALKWLVKTALNLEMFSGLACPVKIDPGKVAPNQNSRRICSTLTSAPGVVRMTSALIRFFGDRSIEIDFRGEETGAAQG